MAGPITNRLGYRWTTILGLIPMNATMFISFFADSLTLLVVGQALEGVPWGFFIANAPAYASETVPLVLRAKRPVVVESPLVLQWIFPTPLLVLIFLAPESPWWLMRRGRKDEAFRSLERLGSETTQQTQHQLAMIERTVEIEAKIGGTPTLLDLFKGTDLRRTTITCLMYASQNFAGNLIANQETFFFEEARISSNRAFQLNLINFCLQFVANSLSWFLTR
ncbi:maltose permease [Phlyctema vagabunda]|uniref:Maltose permease n=1 Tax=Phlyctema vagabunda TaxID=108571 RepID=A0ABR4PF77_9HELO